LDSSPDEQRRMRELIALFTEKETLDELGIGQIRDVFSNALFPGISVIQTRARYLLLVPWAFLAAARSRGGGTIREKADWNQRRTVETLLQLSRGGNSQEGVIGARAGVGVKTLPSAIYWNALRTYGILQSDLGSEHVSGRRLVVSESDELSTRTIGDWHPELRVPAGFPSQMVAGLELANEEAQFLRERILQSVPNSLLAHLVSADRGPDADSQYPWVDSVASNVEGELAETLTQARLFSHAIHGASLLYAALVAEAYHDAGYDSVGDHRESTRRALDQWWASTDVLSGSLAEWNLEGFWRFVRDRNARISGLTHRFVSTWVGAVRDGTAQHAAEDDRLRRLVRSREQEMKRGQARLANPKLLGLWGGFGGGGALSYRWPTVKTIVGDIHRGLARPPTAPGSARS
jgi:hypothetical protein